MRVLATPVPRDVISSKAKTKRFSADEEAVIAPFLKGYLPYLAFRVHDLMTTDLNSDFRSLGYSMADWRILANLGEAHNGGMTINQLTDFAMMSQPTVSRVVGSLEKRKLVKRTDDLSDGRFSIISITAAGRNAFGKLSAIALSKQEAALSGYSKADAKKFIELLSGLVFGLEKTS